MDANEVEPTLDFHGRIVAAALGNGEALLDGCAYAADE
jgi:hypothetical protein